MKKGFTLIELLIVIAIIAILAAIAVPNFLEAQIRAKVSRVKADQRSLATGLEAYYVDNNSYPAWACLGPTGVSPLSCSIQWDNTNPNLPGHANGFSGMGTGAASIHSFRVHKAIPGNTNSAGYSHNLFMQMTTPISYITNYFPDPFSDTRGATYGYYGQRTGWILYSFGPDTDERGAASDPNVKGDIDYYVELESVYNYRVANPTLHLIAGPWFNKTTGQIDTGRYPSGAFTDYKCGAFTYDPTNGTASEGDVYRVKQ